MKIPTALKATATGLALLVLAGWVAWLRSPERAALLLDEEIAAHRRLIASEQAELIRERAGCLADAREYGPAFASATCDHARLQAVLAHERLSKARAGLLDLERRREELGVHR